jgi:hypothetical protein
MEATVMDIAEASEFELEQAGWVRVPNEEFWTDPRTGCRHDALVAMYIIYSRRALAQAWQWII